jgi:mitotic spindle assembly checkpoint protein MAD1
MALLRRREVELSNVEKIASETREAADALQAEVQALKEKVVRREQRTQLAEREASFLQALIVSVCILQCLSCSLPDFRPASLLRNQLHMSYQLLIAFFSSASNSLSSL